MVSHPCPQLTPQNCAADSAMSILSETLSLSLDVTARFTNHHRVVCITIASSRALPFTARLQNLAAELASIMACDQASKGRRYFHSGFAPNTMYKQHASIWDTQAKQQHIVVCAFG